LSPTKGGKKLWKAKTFDKTSDDDKVEIVVEDGNHKKEYVVESADPRHDAVMRRRAYDAHLKTDILYSGRQGSMNATFDPYLYHGGHGYGYGYGAGAYDYYPKGLKGNRVEDNNNQQEGDA